MKSNIGPIIILSLMAIAIVAVVVSPAQRRTYNETSTATQRMTDQELRDALIWRAAVRHTLKVTNDR